LNQGCLKLELKKGGIKHAGRKRGILREKQYRIVVDESAGSRSPKVNQAPKKGVKTAGWVNPIEGRKKTERSRKGKRFPFANYENQKEELGGV